MTLQQTLFPTYLRMLAALSAWLDKAEAQRPGGGADALLSARIAADMFPLATQIRFACVQAREGVHRLRDEAFAPPIATLLTEGRNAGDQPGTIADARTRIAETIAFVEAASVDTGEVDPDLPIAHDLPNGMIFDLSAADYVRDWALPQFYFHLMIAYAILRQEDVALGKADYVAHMFAHLRPDTMPE